MQAFSSQAGITYLGTGTLGHGDEGERGRFTEQSLPSLPSMHV